MNYNCGTKFVVTTCNSMFFCPVIVHKFSLICTFVHKNNNQALKKQTTIFITSNQYELAITTIMQYEIHIKIIFQFTISLLFYSISLVNFCHLVFFCRRCHNNFHFNYVYSILFTLILITNDANVKHFRYSIFLFIYFLHKNALIFCSHCSHGFQKFN